jgi:conjugal transfer pilus assembly protein TraU
MTGARTLQAAAVLVTAIVAAGAAWAQAPADAAVDCDSAPVIGASLFTDFCWDCVFPIRIAGVGGGPGDAPARANSQPLCLCQDALGVPHVGVTISLWEPARIVELVNAPGCSPALGGLKLPNAGVVNYGTHGTPLNTVGDAAFQHYHVWAFPVMVMLKLLTVDRCIQDGYLDLDLLYLSELDPTWAHSQLAYWTTPEVALVSQPEVGLLCVADALAANAGEPIDELFWCAGSWGSLYALDGIVLSPASRPVFTSLMATRALAVAHRRGLSWRTMGSDTLCDAKLDPFIPKSQYQMSMWHPLAEANGRHAIGESALQWGEWRNVPGQDDTVYVVWRWNDCCTARR